MQDVPHLYITSRAELRAWLQKNHATAQSVWLVVDKGKRRTITWAEIVQEALCFGWIDGKAMSVSDTQSKQYLSKRKPKGVWSKINKAHVERLIAEGLMTPAGLRAIQTAKQNGAWDTLNQSDNLELPPALVELFKHDETARTNFEAFAPSSKKVILYWIYSAKTEPTRQKRIQETADMAGKGLKAYPKYQ